ncbi:hypothetical protein R6Q59_021026 [Mikania micrantha]
MQKPLCCRNGLFLGCRVLYVLTSGTSLAGTSPSPAHHHLRHITTAGTSPSPAHHHRRHITISGTSPPPPSHTFRRLLIAVIVGE